MRHNNRITLKIFSKHKKVFIISGEMLKMASIGDPDDSISSSSENIYEDLPEEESITIRNIAKRPRRPSPTTVRNTTPPEEPTLDSDFNENTQTSFVDPFVQQVQSGFENSFSPPRKISTASVSSSLFFQPKEFVSQSSLTPGIIRQPQRFSSPSQPSSGTCNYVCQLSGGCSVRIQATGFTNYVA